MGVVKDNNAILKAEHSYYDDKAWKYALFQLLYFLMGLLSATLLSPLTIYLSSKRKIKHTIISGHRMKFDGKLYQIYGHYALWILLSVATIFIFTFFINTYIRKWVIKHTYFEDEYNVGTSYYTGNGIESLFVNIVTMVVRIFTLGILGPKAIIVHEEMMVKRNTISGHKLLYIGGFDGVLSFGVENLALTIFTLGLYLFVKSFYINQWSISRTIIDDNRMIRHDKSKMYQVIDCLMRHQKLFLLIFILLILGVVIGIICFYYFWKGTIQGFIIFSIVTWLVIYSLFFASGNHK
jgi:hypothetical protein